jgi:hypothetical protein
MKRSQSVTQVLKSALALVTTFSSAFVLAQTAPVGESATSVTTAKPATNKFGLVLGTSASQDFFSTRKVGGTGTENVISVSYKPVDDYKFAVTLVNNYTLVGSDAVQSQQKASYRDLSLSMSTTHVGVLGTESTPVKYKFNLPTSEASQTSKQAFSLGAEISLGYELTSNLAANILLVPGWNLKNGASDEVKNQTNAELRYAHTSKLSTYGFLDHKIKGKTEAGMPLMDEIAAVGIGASYSPNKVVDLGLSVSRDRNIFQSAAKNKSVEFAFLDEKEISYTAEAVLKF